MSGSAAVDKAVGKTRASTFLKMGVTGLVVLVAAAIGFFFVLQFVQSERARELQRWQTRLGIVADSRFADVSEWMEDQLFEMRALADNASLQLYMTILHGEESDESSAELEFLGNLLTATAHRAGFQADTGADQVVNANISRQGLAGIALLDDEGEIVVASQGFPPVQGKLKAFVAGVEKGEVGISQMFLNSADVPSMAFLVPVFALQGDTSAASQIGVVIGVKQVEDELPPLLEQPGALEDTAEAIIVRQAGSSVEYLTPLANGAKGMRTKLSMDTPNLAAAFILRDGNAFGAKTDYRGNEVLVLGRAFDQVPWTLIYKIDTSEALAESEERLNVLLTIFAMIIILLVIGMLALWYFGSSKRATEAAEKFEKLADRFEGQRNFMHLVTDSQPNAIVIFDEEGHYRWFNEKAVEFSGMERRDLFDKNASAVLGPIEGKKIVAWVREALAEGEPISKTHEMELSATSGARVYRSEFIPLEAREDMPAGALMVSQDITDSVRERQKREQVMRQLVNTLVSLVDRRDPFSAHHSARVSDVARAVATEMDLDSVIVETASIAGSLMNLGKIEIPAELLTKQGALTEEERKTIQNSVLTSADLVRQIEFDGPVFETLGQLLENVDGSGLPSGLVGDKILISARVASVANAFVGMTSARSWRQGMDFDKAVDILFQDSNKKFDRAAVVALANYLDNRGGRDEWADFKTVPEGA